jgi:hypothetical protein
MCRMLQINAAAKAQLDAAAGTGATAKGTSGTATSTTMTSKAQQRNAQALAAKTRRLESMSIVK